MADGTDVQRRRSPSDVVSMLGAGSFGTAVATALCRTARQVRLYCRTSEQAEAINDSGHNDQYYPGHRLPQNLMATDNLTSALSAGVIFLAFPAREMGRYADIIASRVSPGTIVVNLVKGLHDEYFTFAELFRKTAPDVVYVTLKGPTFARPLFLSEWSGLTCASESRSARKVVGDLFRESPIVLDYSDHVDVIDTLSATKNVYAILLGIAAASGLSENTTYLLITLVMREIRTIIKSLDYPLDALLSNAGIGDTLLTALCDTSRNRTLGLMLGKGILASSKDIGFLAEGRRVIDILDRHLPRVDLPLMRKTLAVLEGRETPVSVFAALDRMRVSEDDDVAPLPVLAD